MARSILATCPGFGGKLNGAQLTAYMIDYGVGVSIQRTIKIGRIDSDYFELS